MNEDWISHMTTDETPPPVKVSLISWKIVSRERAKEKIIFEDYKGKFIIRAKVDINEEMPLGYWIIRGDLKSSKFVPDRRHVEKIYIDELARALARARRQSGG